MSNLFRVHQVEIQRQTVSNTASASDQKSYSTSARGSLPVSPKCRVVPLSSRDRAAYATVDQRVTHRVFFLEDPEVDERDKLVYCERDLFVTSARNPDHLDKFWIVECTEYTGSM